MKAKHLLAIGLIFLGTLIAWMILGAATTERTDSSYSSLKGEVASLYGGDLIFRTPLCFRNVERITTAWEEGREVQTTVLEPVEQEAVESNVTIDVSLDRRKRGNLWFPTFRTRFVGEYLFRVDDPEETWYLYSALESSNSIYSHISLAVNGQDRENLLPLIRHEAFTAVPDEDGYIRLKISYESTGMENLYYYITEGDSLTQLNAFHLTINTDFKDFDLPPAMMSPTEKRETEKGFELIWDLDKAVTGKDLGLVIPGRLNPGEIVTRVTFFAPVPLLFFFTVLLIVTVIMKCPFHPMHYFFLAATFFSFHLMYSYFSDHMNLYLTFALASVISLMLTVTYLRLFAPPRIAYLIAPAIQLVYLVFFSWSFFFDGITGIILTICSVLTLFLLMQLTGRIEWNSLAAGPDQSGDPVTTDSSEG
jgi:hypothetical protein